MLDKLFGEYAKLARYILVFIGIAGVCTALYFIFKHLEKARINNLINNTSATANVNGTPVTVNIGSKAAEIYDALHGSWYSEDEVKAVNAVLSVPKPLIPTLKTTYYIISGNINLEQDLQAYLDSSQWASIASQFQ